jgi:hypothetical protein
MSLQMKLDLIAAALGARSGAKEWKRAKGGQRGAVDYSIRFDNGETMFVGNSCSGRTFAWYVDNLFALYNPERVHQTKEWALVALRERASVDNAIAQEKCLLPHEVVSVELNGTETTGKIGWYYPVLMVAGHTFSHSETGTHYDILQRKLRKEVSGLYYIACGVRDDEADYVFDGVGFSSRSPLYKMSRATYLSKGI